MLLVFFFLSLSFQAPSLLPDTAEEAIPVAGGTEVAGGTGGGWHGGYYGGWRGGYGWYGFGLWGYPYGWGYPYAYPYGYPYYGYPYSYPYAYSYPSYPPADTQLPVPSEPQQSYWYYCQDPQGYYPYVRNCPGGWTQVVPTPPPVGKGRCGTMNWKRALLFFSVLVMLSGCATMPTGPSVTVLPGPGKPFEVFRPMTLFAGNGLSGRLAEHRQAKPPTRTSPPVR